MPLVEVAAEPLPKLPQTLPWVGKAAEPGLALPSRPAERAREPL